MVNTITVLTSALTFWCETGQFGTDITSVIKSQRRCNPGCLLLMLIHGIFYLFSVLSLLDKISLPISSSFIFLIESYTAMMYLANGCF